jgi:hypothetical protein
LSDFSSSYDSYDNSDASSGVVGFGDEGDVISDVVVSFLKIRYWTLHSAVTKLLLLILDVHIKDQKLSYVTQCVTSYVVSGHPE